MTERTSTPSGRLVEFLLSLTMENVPQAVLRQARCRLLDGLGCGLYGAMMPWSKIAAQTVYEEQTQGRATLYGNSGTAAPARAALVNGIAIHGFEFDDFAEGAHVHPGAVIIPAVLAAAEHYELSGSRLLLGVIAGYDAVTRVGAALGEAGWGFHITGIAGPAGAAIACGVALGMPHDQIMRAIGIACSSAAGIKSFTQGNGGMIKRMHAGRAAESGVLACQLARRGFSAPTAALEGKFGLLEVYGGQNADPQALDRNLDVQSAFSRIWTKVYPCCVGLHTAMQALYTLRIKHGIESTAIKSISIGTNKRGLQLYTEVAPRETMAAQYSMPFTAALALARDSRDPRSFVGDALHDSVVCDLASRVSLHVDADMEAVYPRLGAHVAVCLADGRTLEANLIDVRGTPADPCSDDDIEKKFRGLAAVSYAENAIAEILSVVGRLETLASVESLSSALRTGIRG